LESAGDCALHPGGVRCGREEEFIMSRRPVVRVCALAFLAASLVTGPVFAKSPTKLVSYVVEAKIFTKFLFENNGAHPTEGFQGDINGRRY
jgi:hypothetical protein